MERAERIGAAAWSRCVGNPDVVSVRLALGRFRTLRGDHKGSPLHSTLMRPCSPRHRIDCLLRESSTRRREPDHVLQRRCWLRSAVAVQQ